MISTQPLQGILLIDKPKGWTSFDVVNYVRKIVATANGTKPKNTKVGHTGTLDPAATGLLVLLVGKDYTRRAGEFGTAHKTYEVTMKLGEVSSTADQEGEITVVSDTIPDLQAIQTELAAFTGEIMQTPPAFSAMKVNGQRAYKLAREGKPVQLEARPVTIYSNTLQSYDYPFIRFTSQVSSGTYIRSLVEDIGSKLGTGAYMSDLRRTDVASFKLADALTIDSLNAEKIYRNLKDSKT